MRLSARAALSGSPRPTTTSSRTIPQPRGQPGTTRRRRGDRPDRTRQPVCPPGQLRRRSPNPRRFSRHDHPPAGLPSIRGRIRAEPQPCSPTLRSVLHDPSGSRAHPEQLHDPSVGSGARQDSRDVGHRWRDAGGHRRFGVVLRRQGNRPAEPTQSPTPSASASASPSATEKPLTAATLLEPADLAALAPASAWAITGTTEDAAEHTGRVACLSSASTDVNPTTSLQRLLATSGEDQLAALHQIDVYASADAATQVFTERTTLLSACPEVPAHIVRSAAVTGLADQAFQITVAFENATATQFHTILVTRAGAAVQTIDLARNGEAVAVDALAAALTRSQTALCDAEGPLALPTWPQPPRPCPQPSRWAGSSPTTSPASAPDSGAGRRKVRRR